VRKSLSAFKSQCLSKMSPLPPPPSRFPDASDMRKYSRAQRAAGKTIALVPTMVRVMRCRTRALYYSHFSVLMAACCHACRGHCTRDT